MRKQILNLSVVVLIAAIIYAPGLDGELIFDDRPNLEPVRMWLDGEMGWQQVVLGNDSGPLGRPLTMLSFVANGAVSGNSVWGLKFGNLVLHLATGLLLFFVLLGIAIRDRVLANIAGIAALTVTAVWLLHPLLVSTVLYTVQRMAILSAMFVFAAILAYMHGRRQVEEGKARAGSLWIFAGVPILTALAAFSKETGLLAPLLCGVLEWVYFAPKNGSHRPWQARLFVTLGVGFPVLAATLILIFNPDFYLSGYANRPFGPMERLLTQGRVLFDYLGNILLPAGPTFSLLRDDYTISTGLLTPITTLISWAGWLVIVGVAVLVRKRIPGFTAGIGIFLVGHSMESSIFPLLIYFEHRNYLPAIGILWAVASLLAVAGHWVASRVDNPKLILTTSLTALLVVLAAATNSRARIWQSNELLTQQSLQRYPDSRHLRIAMQRIEMQRPFPDIPAAKAHAEHLLTLDRTSTRMIGQVSLLLIDCQFKAETDPDLVEQTFQIHPDTIEADLFTIIDLLTKVVLRDPCRNLSPYILANGIVDVVNSSDLPDKTTLIWRLHALAARLYYASGNLPSAYRHARKAWEASPRDIPTGMMLVGLSINLRLIEQAEELLDDIEGDIPKGDKQGQTLASSYRDAIEKTFASGMLEHNPRYKQLFPETLPEQ